MIVLLSGMVMADNGVYTDVNYNENSIYNLTDVNSTSFYGSLIGSVTEWISMASLQSKWFANVANVLTFNETELNVTIDARASSGAVTSVATTAPITGGDITSTGTISLVACSNAEGYVYNTTSGAFECTAIGSGTGSVTSIATDDIYLTGGPITGSGTITFNETKLNTTIDARDTDTTYTAGNGIDLSSTTFSVAGNTAITQDVDGLSVTADGITDTQLAFNTGQDLTTTSDVVFDELNISTALSLANNKWLRALNNAGDGFVNMFKVNTDDIIESGANLSIGSISIVEDSGVISLVDMSVSATPTAGTDEGYNFSVDGNTFLKIFADADSSGGITNRTIWVDDDVNIMFDNGAKIVVNSTCMTMLSPAGTGILNVCD